jgi:hypothetical protein
LVMHFVNRGDGNIPICLRVYGAMFLSNMIYRVLTKKNWWKIRNFN